MEKLKKTPMLNLRLHSVALLFTHQFTVQFIGKLLKTLTSEVELEGKKAKEMQKRVMVQGMKKKKLKKRMMVEKKKEKRVERGMVAQVDPVARAAGLGPPRPGRSTEGRSRPRRWSTMEWRPCQPMRIMCSSPRQWTGCPSLFF